jgi:Sigma-70 region 2
MAGMHLGPALRHMHRLFGDGTLAELTDVTLLQQYACQRDELAFEALVQRHGPMVMAVCRGILADPNDADDAFQAAFLLLARKAGALSTTTLHATVRAARHFLLGDAAAAGTVSTATTIMVDQALRSMMITKLKMAGAAALTLGLLSFVASGLAAMGPANPRAAPTASIPNDDDSPRPAPKSAPTRPAGQAKTTETKNNILAFQGLSLPSSSRG